MISYTKRYVDIISLIITILIYIFFTNLNIQPLIKTVEANLFSNIFKKNIVLVELSSNNINQNTKEENKNQNNQTDIENENSKKEESYSNIQTKEKNWTIKIPKISLEASISEGTEQEVMEKYVGHFEETSKKSGNVGLAAHNRGYAVNYFAKIKELQEGDEIIYKYNDFEKTYVVIKNKIIKDTDWEDLENTKENKITLITCVENEPKYRRCIQGIEKLNKGT